MDKKLECETCEKYGDIHKVKLKKDGEVSYVCYECGAMWDSEKKGLMITMDKYFELKNIILKFEEAFEVIE